MAGTCCSSSTLFHNRFPLISTTWRPTSRPSRCVRCAQNTAVLGILTIYLQSFADVPLTEHGVETEPFLEASDGLLQMFGEDAAESLGNYSHSSRRAFVISLRLDLLGSGSVFGFVQSDIKGNIAVRLSGTIASAMSAQLLHHRVFVISTRRNPRNVPP